jgi:hypothetical protein
MCSRETALERNSPRSIRSYVMLVGGAPRRERTNSTRREPRGDRAGILYNSKDAEVEVRR